MRKYFPDASVSVTDRNGKLLDRADFLGLHIKILPKIDAAKADFMKRFGPECYTFVNIYC